MGVLTDYFLATESELKDVGGTVPTAWARVDAKGFSNVPCEKLGERLGVEALEPGEPVAHDEEYTWFVQTLTESMVAALAGMSAADVQKHGAFMAKTPELGWSEQQGTELLAELAKLAKQGLKEGKRMYMWTSL